MLLNAARKCAGARRPSSPIRIIRAPNPATTSFIPASLFLGCSRADEKPHNQANEWENSDNHNPEYLLGDVSRAIEDLQSRVNNQSKMNNAPDSKVAHDFLLICYDFDALLQPIVALNRLLCLFCAAFTAVDGYS
jgi:hypothetical protein